MRRPGPDNSKTPSSPEPQRSEGKGLNPSLVDHAHTDISPITLPPPPSITLEDFTLRPPKGLPASQLEACVVKTGATGRVARVTPEACTDLRGDPRALPLDGPEMEHPTSQGGLLFYTTPKGGLRINVYFQDETAWMTQKAIAELFGVQVPAITKHLKNIYDSRELAREATISKMEIVQTEGKRKIIRNVSIYSLDMIISVGYRVNSQKATRFRQWATKVLKDYTVKGYAINQKRLEQKGYVELEQAVDLVSKTMRSKQLQAGEAKGLLNVITDYMQTWILLQAYDDGSLKSAKSKIPIYEVEVAEAQTAIDKLKQELISQKKATELFATNRGHGLSAIIGSINQSFGGQDVYPTINDKAAHLLYFVVKDHPFVDGNKRSGAMLFIWYLAKNKMLSNKLNQQTLAAITLLVAQSDPKQKDIMVKLITNLIS